MKIHPTALVDSKARLAQDVTVGPFSVIEDGVEIGPGTVIASHVVVKRGTTIGEQCRIHSGAVIGDEAQDREFTEGESFVRIGNRDLIREHVTIHRGTQPGSTTVVGDDNFLMAGSHIAHNCHLGSHIVLANNVLLAGYVEIEDHAFLSGGVVVHQYSKIGKLAMVGGNTRVIQDVPPFILASDFHVAAKGLNLVGLRRYGMKAEQVRMLKRAYQLLFRSKLPLDRALQQIEKEIPSEETLHLVRFVRRSERGICRE